MRGLLEKLGVPVASGLILWVLTNRVLQPTPAQPVPADTAVKSAHAPLPGEVYDRPLPWRATAEGTQPDDLSPRAVPKAVRPLAATPAAPQPLRLETLLFEDNFSRYGEGETTPWGNGAFVRLGQDQHPWLVAHVDGLSMVGRSLVLPYQFSIECRYSAPIPEVTRGVLGWWKQPLTSRIVFVDSKGTRHSVDWQLGCEQDNWRPNGLGTPLFAKKYYHLLRLPSGISNEIRVGQPNGILRIHRNKEILTVMIDGQVVVSGPVSRMDDLARFEIGLVKTSNGTLSLTDFKVSREQ